MTEVLLLSADIRVHAAMLSGEFAELRRYDQEDGERGCQIKLELAELQAHCRHETIHNSPGVREAAGARRPGYCMDCGASC